jgi:DNA helicase-2/ATP-dependent DNA helicase PcrA
MRTPTTTTSSTSSTDGRGRTTGTRSPFMRSPLSADAGPEALQRLMGAEYPLSAQQFAAVTAPLAPQVVVAGAGSGKTTVMAARVVWLVATGQVEPRQVLGLTFTTKATHELGARIRDSLRAAGILRPPGERPPVDLDDPDAGEAEEPTVATYNAYAASLLTEHGLRIGHEPDTRVVADASRYQLAARVIARHRARVELLSDHPGTVIDNLLALDSAMSEHLVGPDDVRAFQARHRSQVEDALAAETYKTKVEAVAKVLNTFGRREELLGLVESYRRLKRELGLMDFSDQIELGARLADDQPQVGALEREKYRVVLLDEYQDTSVAQALMLSRLFSGPDTDHGRGHAVSAVGDPNQAIYGWRGASVSNIVGFGSDFPTADGSPDVATFPLSVNRRSDARILEAANDLARPLYAQFASVRALEPKPRADPGVVRVAVHRTYDDELAWLATQVVGAHRSMTTPSWREIGVLTRDNAHAADVFDALTRAEVPVEIVGLQGLLRLPEVAEVVATLTLLHDLTANAELLTLLTGPRWSVGTRDLALLGQRARRLTRVTDPRGRERARDLGEELEAAVAGADPTEVVSLSDALEDPGDAAYSAEARERFGLLAGELRYLRSHAGEPLLDLVRRIVDTTGIDVELASSVSPAAQARRDNVDLFVKAVADFQAVDGAVTLPALLAYLQAEDEYGSGLDVATPTEADSVKLLTVHRSKGLEWDAVFLVGVADAKFPSGTTRTRWPNGPAVLPSPLRGDAADLPVLTGWSAADLAAFGEATRTHERQEELRLAYVAVTRARHLLVVSSYCWTAGRAGPLGPSPYQFTLRDTLAGWQQEPELWVDKPAKGEANPLAALPSGRPWPMEAHAGEVERRLRAAEQVRLAIARQAATAARAADPGDADAGLDMVEAARVHEWDTELDRLLEEARRDRADEVVVALPSSLSATALVRLRDDPDGLAADLARPMPRRPSPAARFGTRFHAWVEARFGQQQLVDPDDLPGRADAEVDDEDDLLELVALFEKGDFADRTPVAVEPPFALVLAGQVVRGRIDAVYADSTDGGQDGFLVVDWKTSRTETADPLQLAVYRLAWAELAGVPVERVRAAFYYVRTGQLVQPAGLPDRAGLERLLPGAARRVEP